MKFYLCETADGPQYVHLQADAKKIDPAFKTVEIDLSKGAIMERLNDLMRRAHNPAARSEEPGAVSRPAPPKPGAIGTFAEGNEPTQDSKWHGEDAAIRQGKACNVCHTRKEIENWRASSEAGLEIETLVVATSDETHLKSIQRLITERLDEIANDA